MSAKPSVVSIRQAISTTYGSKESHRRFGRAADTNGLVTKTWSWLFVLMSGCSNEPELAPVPELTRMTDTNPDPNLVEVTLVASAATFEYVQGQVGNVLAYRDGAIPGSTPTIPGPMIEANQGDRLIVHFRNELDRETSVHWHGLRLPIDMDGINAVAAGGTFDYDFVLRDAGWHWYHPHIQTDEQIELGLQGTLLVHGTAEPAIAIERTFVIDDVELDDRGDVVIEPSHEDLVHGRRGDTLLVNGKPPGFVVASAGAVERWRIVNTSNGRFFKLHLDDVPLRVIGWDGGLIASPYDVTELLVGPGERYDVVVALDRANGDELRLETLEVMRGHGAVDRGPLALVTFRLDAAPVTRDEIPATGPVIDRLPVTPQTVSRRFALSEELAGATGTVYFINDQRWPLNTPIDVRLGDVEIWDVVNETDGEHPMHVHGHFVQVLDRDGVAEPQLGWKDTIVLGPQQTLRAALRYDEPGMWMFHCQIPEHAERGMTADIDVQP
jgi:FtsP/CotA-like multicopper oxidase with cupredoxin domain